jgi:beta-barrel assembly-enhancing protease
MHRVFFCALAMGFLAACGPQLQPPGLPQPLVEREREQQQELAARLYLERAERVHRIAGLLRTHGAGLCDKEVEPWLGVFWIGLDSFPYDYKDVVARRFGLNEDNLLVVSISAGQPAALAGLRPGDAIVKIGDTPISSYKSWYSLTKVEHAHNLIRKIGKNSVDLELQRGGETLSVRIEPISACRYPVEILVNDRVNAFANGERIGVTTGMLRFTGSDDEIALILGHEMAHNLLNHIERSRGMRSLGAAAGILLDVGMLAAGMHTGGLFGQAGNNIGRLVFSKEFEAEADYLGLYFAAKAGFDIAKASNVFRRMAAEHVGSTTENFLSSHPSTPERSVAMEAGVKEVEGKLQADEPLIPRRIDDGKSGAKP